MKIGLYMIVAGDPVPVINCINSQKGLMDCGVVLVDSKQDSDHLYNQLVSLNIPNLLIKRHVWRNSFAQARNESLDILLSYFIDIDYVYWVDGDDVWDPKSDFKNLRDRLEKERPDAVNLIYQYADNVKLYRNRLWKVINSQVQYYWRGGAHEVEWATDGWPAVTNWDDYRIIHDHKSPAMPSLIKRSRNIDILRSDVENDPTFSRNYYYLGQELYDNSEYSEAIAILSLHVLLDSSVAERYQSYLLLSKAYLATNDLFMAKEMAECAIVLYPDAQFAYTMLGNILVLEKKWEEAIPEFIQAITVPGAPVIFDFESLRTVTPLRQLSVCYEKIGDMDSARYYHYLANKCDIDDGLRARNGVWLSSNKFLKETEQEHFNKTAPPSKIDQTHYMIVNHFNEISVKNNLLGAMAYNSSMKIVRILNEGSDNETAIVFKGIPDYATTVTSEEKHRLAKVSYKDLFRSEQFSLFEDFYQQWIAFAVKRSKFELISIVELGTDIGLSARLMRDVVSTHRRPEHYDITLVDTNLTKETWAIVDNENIFFIHHRAETAAQFFEDDSIDVLHMDLAPHSYEQAVEIFKLYEPKLTKEGIMIWHDVGKSKRFQFGGRKFLDGLRYPWCISYCEETNEMSDEAPAVIWRELA